jgi:hypothetical protein
MVSLLISADQEGALAEGMRFSVCSLQHAVITYFISVFGIIVGHIVGQMVEGIG